MVRVYTIIFTAKEKVQLLSNQKKNVYNLSPLDNL